MLLQLTALLECLNQFECNGPCHNLCWLLAYNRYCSSLIWSNVTVTGITAITQSTTWSGDDKWPCDAIDVAVPIDSNWCSELLVVSDCAKPLTLLVKWMHLMQWDVTNIAGFLTVQCPGCRSTAWSAVVAPNVADWVIVPCSWHSCHCWITIHDALSVSTAKSTAFAPNVTDWVIVQCNRHSCHCWITAHDAVKCCG